MRHFYRLMQTALATVLGLAVCYLGGYSNTAMGHATPPSAFSQANAPGGAPGSTPRRPSRSSGLQSPSASPAGFSIPQSGSRSSSGTPDISPRSDTQRYQAYSGTSSQSRSSGKHSSSGTLKLMNKIVAIVNNKAITEVELSQAVKETRAQLREAGNQVPDTQTLKRQVLQKLITKKIALQLAKKNNIVVSSLEVTKTIQNILKKNNVNLSQLKARLRLSGISYQSYRKNIKEQLIISKLQQQAVAKSINISSKEIEEYLQQHQRKQNKEYRLQHILLPLPTSRKPEETDKAMADAKKLVEEIRNGKISFTEAANQYSQSSDALQGGDLGYEKLGSMPKIFAKRVPDMQQGEIKGPFIAGGGIQIIKLKDIKEKQAKQHFVTQYDVQKIQINLTPVVDSYQAKEKLARIRTAIQNGASFNKQAKLNSQDHKTARKGGKMGWVTLKEVPYSMAQKIRSMNLNEVSQPFKSGDKSWSIIEVLGKRRKNNTEEYRRQKASNALFQKKAQKALKTWMNSLQERAYIKIKNPDLKMPNV